jgi:hypothetical protein
MFIRIQESCCCVTVWATSSHWRERSTLKRYVAGRMALHRPDGGRPQSAALSPCPSPLLRRPYPPRPCQQLSTTGGGLSGLAAVALLPLEVGILRRLGACGATSLGARPNYGASSNGFLTN